MNCSSKLQHGHCFKSMWCSPIKDGDIAMEFYLKKNKIKLSVEYLYIIRYKNRVIVFVRSFPKPTARLQQKKKGNKSSCTLIRHSAFLTLTTKNVNVRVLGKARF